MRNIRIPQVFTLIPKPYIQAFTLLGRKNKKAP